jgi:hypothetical protein
VSQPTYTFKGAMPKAGDVFDASFLPAGCRAQGRLTQAPVGSAAAASRTPHSAGREAVCFSSG